ncbi:CoA-binding protein [Nocardia sp. NPDC049220]|uniref:succinate--CoA ligase subunit alpha n=1 Tax=Nocardia sp. NPDC049220 TaxID=3155273 RepID=UPI0033F1328B
MNDLRTMLEARGVIVHGLAGRAAMVQIEEIQRQGTKVVAGVSSSKNGQAIAGIPLYATIAEAAAETAADVALLFVPAQHAKAATLDALDAGMRLVVLLAEGVPVLDVLAIRERSGAARLIGPNSPGVVVPGVAKLGFMPTQAVAAGRVGLVSRSGTLSYEVSRSLSERGVGISSWIGIGGDVVPFTSMSEAAQLVARDPHTDVLVVVGEIGGTGEEGLAQAMLDGLVDVPVHALIVGESARPDEPLGHAGAVMLGDAGSYDSKVSRLREAGVVVHHTPWQLADAVTELTRGAVR